MEAPEKVMNNEKISSTSSEGRKSSKPIMEKRRRARINASLAELKSLLLEVMKSEGARQNKMEKADILEMTVRHLRQLQRQQYSALSTSDPAIINKYRLGFNECANEVSKFLGSLEGVDTEIRARLLNHLANCTTDTETAQNGHTETVDNCDKPVHASTHNIPIKPAIPSSINHGSNDNQRSTNQMSFTKTHVIGQPTVLPAENVLNSSTQEKNNNVFNALPNILTSEKSVTLCSGDISNPTVQVPKVFGGLQAIPTKLPSGEMAFIIPATNMMSCNTIPNYVIPVLQSPTVQISNTSGQVIPNTSPVHIQYSSNTNNTSHSDSVPSIVNGSAVIANSTSVPISLPSSAFGLPAINNVATVPVNISYGMQRLPAPNTTNLASNPIFGSESVANSRTGSSLFADKQLRPKLNSDPLELPSMNIRNAENVGDQNRGHIHDLCNKQDDMWRPW